MYKTTKILFVVVCLLSFLSIRASIVQENVVFGEILSPPQLNDDWQVADVRFAGLDRQAMIDLTRDIVSRKFLNIHSVLIAHKNRLIYEYYLINPELDAKQARDIEREKTHVLNSVTKSVTSLLLGIALESNFEEALSRPILDYFPGLKSKDSRITDITLEQVLTMTAGFIWNEMDVPYTSFVNDDNGVQSSIDPIGFILSRPIRDVPGTYWYYNGGLTMLAAGVIDSVVDKPLLEFASKVLFKPLKVEKYFWTGSWSTNRLVNAASGLRMRARDLIKIGMLVLNQGRWHEKQIVSSEWIELSTRRIRDDLRSWSADGIYGYGYQWWHGKHKNTTIEFNAITALGYGGQRIFILPEQELVVTVLSANYGDKWLKPEAILKRIVSAYTESRVKKF